MSEMTKDKKITDDELEKAITKILENANLAETTTREVVLKLEKVFGTDLSKKKKVIDQMVMNYVNSKSSEDEIDDEEKSGSDSSHSEDEEDKKPAKRKAPAPKAKSNSKSKQRRKSDSKGDDVDGSDDSESEEEKKKPAKKSKKKKGSDDDSDWKSKGTKAKKAGGRKGGGYTRAYRLSPALADLMGKEEMARHEVVKRMWTIIKEKNLYDPNNKRFAICDEALHKVIGTKRFRTFGMMKYLKNHFLDD